MSLPDQSVDLDRVNIILLLQRILDLPLIRPRRDNEDERVVLLDLLHRALRVERVQQDLVLVDADLLVGDRLARVLGRARQLKSLGPVEGGGLAHFAHLVRVDLC